MKATGESVSPSTKASSNPSVPRYELPDARLVHYDSQFRAVFRLVGVKYCLRNAVGSNR